MLFDQGSDKRFYGVYRGVVADNKDPLTQGRVKVIVPQVLGSAVTTWAYPITGTLMQSKTPYGSFFDTTTQTSVTTEKVVSINTTDSAYGVQIIDNSKITVSYSGVYNLQFSGQINQSANGSPAINIWIKKNGVPVPDSAGQIDLSNQNHYALPSWNYVLPLNAGDYVEFWWNSTSATRLLTTAAGTYAPVAPSIIVTTTLVGDFKPNANDGVWVMFEGGDPNFPLWLGAF